MSRIALPLCLSLLFAYTGLAHAYKQDTHRDMALYVTEASVLRTDSKVLENLGLEPWDKKQTFEIALRGKITITEHIRNGASFEDTGVRSQYHFFDPLRGTGLFGGIASPDWALEDKSDISDQDFSLKDTYARLYKALTLADKDERMHNFGLVFESLGRAVHHIQDMAQPQHVRNDAHCDILPCLLIGKYSPSLYETHTDNVKKRPEFTSLLGSGAYPPVIFDQARKFWTGGIDGDGKGIADYTNHGFVSVGTNFDDASKRYPEPRFTEAVPWEANANELLQSAGISPPSQCLPPNAPCVMTFFRTSVEDRYRPEASGINDKTSTRSIFDQDLQANNLEPAFSLNRFNFDAAHEFLIPRAVAYSAGLIDYFFRGRLEAVDTAISDQGITLKVKNAIDPKGVWSKEIMKPTSSSGKPSQLVVTYDYKDENGNRLFGASNPVNLTEELQPGGPVSGSYTFTFPAPLPDNLDPALPNFRLVYRGALGQEDDAVAVSVFKVVSGFLVQPDYLPQDGIIGPRLIYQRNGQWRLSKAAGLTAGNTDWKGWYVDGKPTKVLSWTGHESRYFPQHSPIPGGDPFRFEIYQSGELFAITPAQVLGAAIMKDGDKNEWLIAICKGGKEGKEDVVYRRPNKKSESMDLYDTELNPEGWKEIGRFLDDPNKDFEPDMPWLFNGDGTEAQTLRRWREPIDPPHTIQTKRLMITIDNNAAKVVNRGNLSGFLNQLTCTSPEASMNQTNTRVASGEYIIAVDYKDKEEVLARVSLNYNQVRALEGVKDSFSSYTLTFRDTETLHWGGTGITYFTSNNELSAIAAAGSGYSDRIINQFEEIRSLFFFDLRYDMLVRGNLKSNDDISRSSPPPSFTNYSTDFQEGTTIISNLGSDIAVYSYHNHDTIPPPPPSQGFEIIGINSTSACVKGTFRSYSTDFPKTHGVGGFWAIDNGGNLFVAQRYYDVDRNLKPFSYLTNGKLEQVIPPGSNDGNYFAIGVIR